MAGKHGRVFISYHRGDLELAGRVRQHLVELGAVTWMDQFDIPAGAYWPDEIDKGLEASETVVGLLSPESVASRNVKNEWDWALQNNKRLLLVQAAACSIPHRYISINIIDATGTSVDQALDALSHSLGLHKPAGDDFHVPATVYARSGEYSIAYQVFGDGPVDLLFVPDFIANIEHFWKLPEFAQFLRRLSAVSRVILFDKRGTGLSDRMQGTSTLEERMDDIRAVLDATGSRQAVIFGIASGAPLSALFAATHPDRTQALIAYSAPAAYVRHADYPWPPEADAVRAEIDALATTIHERWGTEEFADEILRKWAPSHAGSLEHRRWFAELIRVGRSPGAEIARRRMNMEIDIRHVLPTIRVPTLVIYDIEDRETPLEELRYFANQIPGATVVEMPGDNHIWWFDDRNDFSDAIRAFVKDVGLEQDQSVVRDSVLATALSIANANAGVAAEIVRRETLRFRGRQIETSTGIHLIMFDGPARAIRCGVAITRALREADIESACGLHTGEVTMPGSEAESLPARICRQIAELAALGEVVVSSTVKDLVAGSGIRFADHGSHHVPELDDALRLYAVEQGSIVAHPPAHQHSG